MDMSDNENMDSVLASLDEIEADSIEAADFEFENLHSLIAGPAVQQRKSSLNVKLEADPTGGFNVSDFSQYTDDRWVFKKASNSSGVNVLFNSEVIGGSELKKMLVYNLIPQFHPLGRIRSFNTTISYSRAFTHLEKQLFLPNGIDATPESIKVISARLINEALDRSRDEGSTRAYTLLYFIVTFWIALSEQGLIPVAHRLDVPLRLIDTKERQKDLLGTISAAHKGWSPFTEDELSKLIEYAFFWTEKAIPKLLTIRNFLDEHVIGEQKHNHVISSKRFIELEAVLGQEVDGIVVCGYTMNKVITKNKRKKGKPAEYMGYSYYWHKKYLEALDLVRDGILILVALVLGMRNREIGVLNFDDVQQREDGEWEINITRFKTSDDPNYFGDCEIIPLPNFIGEMIQDYRKLREFKNFMRQGLIFEQVARPRHSKLMNRTLGKALRKVGEIVGVDGVHPHRFRKTIAEILISRSELNIDLIRMLFGHKSYTMTLRYIARNPYLIHTISEVMEAHYAEAFMEIVAGVRNGTYSGKAAERIAKSTATRPEIFKGKLLRLTVYNYIAYLLEAGEPVFIQRTGMGIYCVSGDNYFQDNLPPCLSKLEATEGNIVPDTSKCRLDCQNAIVLEGARETLQKNISFYSRLLVQTSVNLTKVAQKQLSAKLDISEKHLAALSRNNAQAVDDAKLVS